MSQRASNQPLRTNHMDEFSTTFFRPPDTPPSSPPAPRAQYAFPRVDSEKQITITKTRLETGHEGLGEHAAVAIVAGPRHSYEACVGVEHAEARRPRHSGRSSDVEQRSQHLVRRSAFRNEGYSIGENTWRRRHACRLAMNAPDFFPFYFIFNDNRAKSPPVVV